MDESIRRKMKAEAMAASGGRMMGHQVDLRQALMRKCHCGSRIFIQAFRVGVVPATALSNHTGQPLRVTIPTLICYGCGKEFGMKEAEGGDEGD